ncbi:MAG: hypothetical protein R3320_10190 [Nitriliruptorales bacterium]|nr:hypothetical protein [Nitriliruptorales bacterium]
MLAADLFRQPAPPPRKIGPLATAVTAESRGVGRFARPRDGAPPPLV